MGKTIMREKYQSDVDKIIEKECKKGIHRLLKIVEMGNDMESKVLRWCEICGSIAIDIDHDGRTSPGAVLGMKSPAIMKALN